MIRITIEGPQGCGKTCMASVIAGILQLMGCRQIQIIDDGCKVVESPQIDALIVCKLPGD